MEIELLGGGVAPRPHTLAELTEFFDNLAKDRSRVDFAIEADGEFIGGCGLHAFDQRSGTAELGIGIGERDYWGRGYGREAVSLLVDYGFRMHNLRKISASHGTPATSGRSGPIGRPASSRRAGSASTVWSDGRYEDLVLMAIFRDPPS